MLFGRIGGLKMEKLKFEEFSFSFPKVFRIVRVRLMSPPACLRFSKCFEEI